MKYAIGLTACIAIVFCWITPQERSRSYAQESSEIAQETMLEQSVFALHKDVATLQRSIDEQLSQVNRQVETKLIAFESNQDTDETWTLIRDLQAKQEKLEERIATLESEREQAKVSYPAVASSGYGSSGGAVSYGSTDSGSYSAAYQPRWQNYDGLSKSQHAAVMHGIDTAGMSEAAIAMALDDDHDTFGPSHSPAMRGRVTTVQSSSNCPGGVCPTNRTTTTYSRGGLLGFGVLGRKR